VISRPTAWTTKFRIGGLCALLLLTAAAPAPAVPLGPVVLAQHPLSKLYFTARSVAKQDLADGDSDAILMLASQSLGTAGTGPALFVQVQSQRSCGSAGCSVSIYLPTKAGWTKILDAVGTLAVLPTVHGGMHDMLVGKGDHWVWNGRSYADTIPAPQVDLTPRNPAPHAHLAPHKRHAAPPK
jgi:hypothetical protein